MFALGGHDCRELIVGLRTRGRQIAVARPFV